MSEPYQQLPVVDRFILAASAYYAWLSDKLGESAGSEKIFLMKSFNAGNFQFFLKSAASPGIVAIKISGVAAFFSVIMLSLFALWSPAPWTGVAFAQEQEAGFEEDPAFLEEQKQLEQDFKDLAAEAADFERELAGEPAPEEKAPQGIAEDPQQLATDIQAILASAGCYTIKVDGKWGPGSRGAVAAFARHSGMSLDGREPTPELAGQLRENYTQGRICPLVCDARHELQGETCVLKTCAKGKTLDKSGACVSAIPVRYGSVCTMGTKLPANPLDCHFLGSMIQDFKQQGKSTKALVDEYNCTCRGRSG